MSCDGDTALLCDGLCYKTVHKWTILVRDYFFTEVNDDDWVDSLFGKNIDPD